MSLPEYPTFVDGQLDHKSAVKEIFNNLPSPSRPQHANVDGTIMTFTGMSPSGAMLFWRFGMDFSDAVTREVRTVEVWDDWVNGPLVPVRVEWLTADQSVYNKEEKESFESAMDRDTSEFLTDNDGE